MWVNGYQSSTPYLVLMFCRFSFVRGQPLDLISALESFFLDIIEIGVFFFFFFWGGGGGAP
jgi:hypothetical protein